jgi:hypothetical protein
MCVWGWLLRSAADRWASNTLATCVRVCVCVVCVREREPFSVYGVEFRVEGYSAG